MYLGYSIYIRNTHNSVFFMMIILEKFIFFLRSQIINSDHISKLFIKRFDA